MRIRRILESQTKVEQGVFIARLCEGIKRFRDKDFNGPKVDPDRISLQQLWEDTVGSLSMAGSGDEPLMFRARDAIHPTAFPKITQALISSKVIEGYEGPASIGEELVTTVPSNRKLETYAGTTEPDELEEVLPGDEYKEAGFGEKYATSRAKKYGKIINVTAELLKSDQTGQIVLRARKLGRNARILKEKIILGCILDLAAWKWYYPDGTSTAVFAAGNTVTSNGLVDFTDIDAARQKLAAQVDSNGNPILTADAILLTPDALLTTANFILNSVQTRKTSSAAPVHIVSGTPVPVRKALSSPFLDLAAFGNSTSTWFYGAFKEAFIYQEIWPIQVWNRGAESEPGFMRDVEMQFKVRLYGGAACIDNKYVIKNTA